MMKNVLQLGLSLSVLCNLFTIWQLHKALSSQSNHLNSLTDLVIKMAETHPHIKVVSGTILPFNRKK